MDAMFKTLTLLLLFTAITGCQSLTRPADYNAACPRRLLRR